jgi:TolB-like protein
MRIAVCLLALTTYAHAEKKPTLAVLNIADIDGLSAKAADALVAALRVEANAKSSSYVVKASPKDTQAAIMTAECSTDTPSCAAKLGTKLGADYTIAGELEKRGKNYIVTLALVDSKTKQRVRSIRDTSSADPKKWAKKLYTKLVDSEAGQLAVVANAQDGEVWIDGQLVGALFQGKTTITGLINGGHQLSIRANGYRPLDVDITIEWATKQMVLLDPL